MKLDQTSTSRKALLSHHCPTHRPCSPISSCVCFCGQNVRDAHLSLLLRFSKWLNATMVGNLTTIQVASWAIPCCPVNVSNTSWTVTCFALIKSYGTGQNISTIREWISQIFHCWAVTQLNFSAIPVPPLASEAEAVWNLLGRHDDRWWPPWPRSASYRRPD